MIAASHLRRRAGGAGPLFVAPLAALVLAACAGRGTPAASATPGAAEAAAAGDQVTLVLAATTDVHGWLRGWDYYANAADTTRGLARAAAVVDSIRAANPGRVLLVDSGDLLQGTPLTYVAARRTESDTATHPVVAAMNAMRYDAAAIGNHEFNYGVPVLDRAIARAGFPFLAANAYRPDGRRAYQAYTIVDRAGVKVGLVGGSTPGSMVWDRDHLRGRVVMRDLVPEVRTAVADARRAGAQVVVAILHSGLAEPSSYDTVTTGVPSENVAARVAREVPGVDAIVFGHSHKEVADTTINGVLLVQPKNWATSVAALTLRLERAAGGWRVAEKHGQLVRTIRHPEQADVVAAAEPGHRAAVAYATAAIGTTPVAWRADSARVADTPLIDFVLEVERRVANADIAAASAFNLDASLDSGAITVGEVARLYPYENTLRAVRVSGRQVRAFLEHSARYYVDAGRVDPEVPGYNFDILSGVDYTLDLSRPLGSRVTRLDWKGRPLRDDDSLTLALNNYRQTGGGGYAMLSGAPVVYQGTQEIRELLIEEVRRRGTLRPEDYFTRNWRLEPATAVASAYAASRGRPGRPLRVERTDVPPRGTTPILEPRRDPPARRLRVIATNDFHGSLEARPDAGGVRRGGAAALAAMIGEARAECRPPDCRSILLDGGDMFQGSLASNLVYGRSVADLYNHLGYTASALGNHEFDWGQDTLRSRMRQARYAILGANVRDANGRDVKWIRDDTLVTRGPWKVGVIGISTVETPRTTRAANTVGLRFLDPAPVVDSLARRLRRRGADAVIVIAHAGAFCDRSGRTDCGGEIIDFARHLTERVDAIVSGHTHSLVDATVNGIPIVQARSNGRALATIDIPMGARGVSADTVDFPPRVRGRVVDVLTDSVKPDPATAALVQRALDRVAPLAARPIATIRDAMRREGDEQYALGNLLADAQRWKAGGDVAVMNNGGIRADLRAGPATYGSLFEIQPFGNVLYRLTVNGADLRAYLEKLVGGTGGPRAHVSGVTVEYDPKQPAGARITRVTMADGRPLDDAATYRVVLNDFLATGGDGLGLAGRSVKSEPLGIPDLDALIDYLKQLPQPVAAPAEERLIPTP